MDEKESLNYPEIVKTLENTPFCLRNEKMTCNIFEEDNEEENENNYQQITNKPSTIPNKFLILSRKKNSNTKTQNTPSYVRKDEEKKQLIQNHKEEITNAIIPISNADSNNGKNDANVNNVSSLLCLNYMTNERNNNLFNNLITEV